jgi:murein DD-endopeptidase MepM/ murein hydrolase activator NlpD
MRISGKNKVNRQLTIVVIFFLLLSQPVSALAARRRTGRSSDSQSKIGSINRELQGIVNQYNSTLTTLENLNKSIQSNQKRIAELNTELTKSQEKLNSRVDKIYRSGDINIVDVLFGSEDFYQLSSRWAMLEKIAAQDADLLNSVKRQRAEAENANQKLVAERDQKRSLKKRLSAKEAALKGKLREQQALLARAKSSRLAAAAASRQRIRVSREGSFSLRGGFIFPVAGPHAYSNDWGDPRDGGRRHQGNDIFALRGTPVVAVVSGSVRAHRSGNAGKMLYLYGSDGNTYEYMHLDGFAVSEGSVSAGQVIGYVGSTGNARGGSPHLHFEIHPGGGGPINPYSILRAAE